MDWTFILTIAKYALIVVIIAITIAVCIFIIFTVLYIPSFLQKKVNLKQAEDIMQHNLEIVEKATFFETSQEFNNIIQEQMTEIRSSAAKLKSLKAEIDQLDKDLDNKRNAKK